MLYRFQFKERTLLTMYKWQVCYAVQKYDIYICQKSLCTYTTFIITIPQIELSRLYKQDQVYVYVYQQTCDRPFTTFVVP
jgi:hypothetical protein